MKTPIFKINDNLSFENCVLAYGHFNSVHPGHIRYLKNASKINNKLVVAVLPDTKEGINNNYQFSQKERADGLSALKIVNGIPSIGR